MTDTAPVIHIMLDLETWGTDPGDDIRSIGACVFDPNIGTVAGDAIYDPHNSAHRFYIATDNPLTGSYSHDHFTQSDLDSLAGIYRQFPLRRNPETVKWWNDQSEEARAAFENPVRLDLALSQFMAWLDNITGFDRFEDTGPSPHLRLWSHGENMDEPILRMAYKACGLPVPWHYRAPRDTRTMFEAAGMDAATCVAAFAAPGAVYHHALDDAITQARAVCAAFAIVNNWRYDAEAHRVDDDIPTPPAAHPYGHCPTCNRPGSTRERRPDGDDRCDSGHRYPSADAKPCRCA